MLKVSYAKESKFTSLVELQPQECEAYVYFELELELIQTHMTQKQLLRVEVVRVCALESKCGRGYWISAVCKSLVCRSRDLKSEYCALRRCRFL